MAGDDEQERTPAGDPIIRYSESKKEFSIAMGDGESMEAVEAHFERYFGKAETVFHEIVSDIVHIDVHWIKPSPERNYHTLFTTGMSDLPMQGPDGMYYAELMISLPPGWRISDEDFRNEDNYWPIRALKFVARFPHLYDTWLGWGHSLPNGDPAEPFAAITGFTCLVLYHSSIAPTEFNSLRMHENKVVDFFTLYPVYTEETDFKLRKGAEPLFNRLVAGGVTDVVDIKRKSVCPAGFWKKLLGG